MLHLEGVEVAQGAFRLTADVRLTAPVTALIGPSGAGKSTVLNAIAGFTDLTRGRVLWDEQEISTCPPAARPVAMLFQDNNLFPHLTIAQNLALALTQGRPSTAQVDRIEDALAQVGLTGFGPRKPGALSGGQQSRAALARVLLQARPLMLLDEPFAALGPAQRREMLDLVVAVAKSAQLQVIMVSHAPEDARYIAQDTALVADGQVHAPVATQNLLDHPPKVLRDYLG